VRPDGPAFGPAARDGVQVVTTTRLATRRFPTRNDGRGGVQGQRRSRVWPRAANSGSLQGGQFLDGGLGAVGMQMHDVTIDCPVAIANNVLSIVVSGVASQGVTVRDVTFA